MTKSNNELDFVIEISNLDWNFAKPRYIDSELFFIDYIYRNINGVYLDSLLGQVIYEIYKDPKTLARRVYFRKIFEGLQLWRVMQLIQQTSIPKYL